MSKGRNAPSRDAVQVAYERAIARTAHIIGIEDHPELQRDIAKTLADSLGGHSAEEQEREKP